MVNVAPDIPFPDEVPEPDPRMARRIFNEQMREEQSRREARPRGDIISQENHQYRYSGLGGGVGEANWAVTTTDTISPVLGQIYYDGAVFAPGAVDLRRIQGREIADVSRVLEEGGTYDSNMMSIFKHGLVIKDGKLEKITRPSLGSSLL